ncbi:lysozyme [Pseudoalteromonas sp. NSLLW218]|uniref:lysozyme n=1 Tax=Pseudoalteromonas sp. NSLLW218 TaxID=2792048 RepID=UPI0018CEC833|nr:lysozyme [Pseudoalteromonas sp. NSLLW218]MBH0088614.1 lysozyme [Pseudoalteromonas sp. NSLLW218]
MKVNKLLAAGVTGVLALAGVMVAEFEGEVRTGYVDPVGVVTACFGHTQTAELGKTYTEKECLNLFAMDLGDHNEQLLRAVNNSLTTSEHVAYLSFHYNVGAGNFRSSALLKYLNNDERVKACNELPRWVYADGLKLAGLVKRRELERKLCLSELTDA